MEPLFQAALSNGKSEGVAYAVWALLPGLTVYAVRQVLAATLPMGALSNQVGTLLELVRVLLLGPVVLPCPCSPAGLHVAAAVTLSLLVLGASGSG